MDNGYTLQDLYYLYNVGGVCNLKFDDFLIEMATRNLKEVQIIGMSPIKTRVIQLIKANGHKPAKITTFSS